MAEHNEKRDKLLSSLQEGVNKEGLTRVKLKYMDVGPRAKIVEDFKIPPGHVEALDAEIARKIERNELEKSQGEREMLDIVVR